MANFLIHLTNDIDFDLEINDRTTVISGDSASGKTFFIDGLSAIISLNYKDALCDGLTPDKFVVVKNENEAYIIKDVVNKIIVIDRYDVFSEKTKKMIKSKMAEQDNTWIVMSRGRDIPTYGSIALKHLKCREENGKKILYLARPY